MGLFDNQFANVVEWNENRDDCLFWKWTNREIKKGSRLVIRPGQNAIVLYNGKIEGIFQDEGIYEVESQIIPFLSTLKGFKFGFNSGLRAEVLFVNTKEFTLNWGTRSAINIPAQGLPGGMPVRAFGTFSIKIADYVTLIDKIAGVKQIFTVDEVQERVLSVLNQILMKRIVSEGKDMFNLQASADTIGTGVRTDMDGVLSAIGLTVTDFQVASFNYPEEIQEKINKTASYNMVGDIDKYQRVAMADAFTNPNSGAGGAFGSVAGMAAGFNMANNFMNNNMNNSAQQNQNSARQNDSPPPSPAPQGQPAFCSECGAPLPPGAKFCAACGKKLF